MSYTWMQHNRSPQFSVPFDVAAITDLPRTVMSRPARGRKRLQEALTKHIQAEVLSELPKSAGTNSRLR